jgi:hypothetical protein
MKNNISRDHNAERVLHGIGKAKVVWYPNGTSSLWRVQEESHTSYRFTVLYIGDYNPMDHPLCLTEA